MFGDPVGTLWLDDPRFAPFWKHAGGQTFWARLRIKAAAREMFEGIDAATDESELWGVVGSEASNIALDALTQSLPQWSAEFVERFNEKARAMATAPTFQKFEARPAVRGIRNVIIGLCGAPGGGKTCSALRLATGLAGADAPIVLIDTECGRSTEFAPAPSEQIKPEFDPELPLFAFERIDLDPPFNPDRYRDAVVAAARRKPRVLIVDNITDELMGRGGQLDMKNSAPPSDKFGWREPKEQHRALMNALRTHPWYVILTIRAKEKIRPASDAEKREGIRGIVNEGWLPQCDGSIPYDCTMLVQVDNGVPQLATERPWKLPPFLRRLIRPAEPLDESAGRRIAEWCRPEGTW